MLMLTKLSGANEREMFVYYVEQFVYFLVIEKWVLWVSSNYTSVS